MLIFPVPGRFGARETRPKLPQKKEKKKKKTKQQTNTQKKKKQKKLVRAECFGEAIPRFKQPSLAGERRRAAPPFELNHDFGGGLFGGERFFPCGYKTGTRPSAHCSRRRTSANGDEVSVRDVRAWTRAGLLR